jgi:peptidoglycan/LPS O-acetylase OafA/YrhL
VTDIREHPPPATAPAAPTARGPTARGPTARGPTATGPGRVAGLDGIRGLAALYVVVYHIFLRAWPGYPGGANHAPFWAVLVSYGRAAVAVFIVLSGFSLGLGPARSGWRLASLATYAHRRAWRILPPYWAALGFSLVMTWCLLAKPHLALATGKSVVVYSLLVQDVFSVVSPNRTFWSIAIEAQLYVLLPLLLLLARRVSASAMVSLVAAVVVVMGVLGPHVALMNTALVKFTPDLAVLFAVGLLASGIVAAGERVRSRPWARYALAAAVPAIALMVFMGSVWSYFNLFWLDLAWVPAIGCFVTAVATSRPRCVVQFLNSRMARSLGSCSYSLYLTHEPIVLAVSYGLVRGHVIAPFGTPMFFLLVAILLPVTVCFARMFSAVFEIPFQRHRGWIQLRQAMSARLRRLRGSGPAAVASRWPSTNRASGLRSQAGERRRPARPQSAADGARPASRPGGPGLPGPGDSVAHSRSC